MKRSIILILTTIFCCLQTSAMKDSIQVILEADVISQYVWRGMKYGHVSIQPTLGISYKGFTLSAWGNVGVSDADDPYELDLELEYSTGGLTLLLSDYWSVFRFEEDTRYFKYDAHQTHHSFEATVGYDFGTIEGMIPLTLTWSTNFGGVDGRTKSGKRAYSSFMELGMPFSFARCDWEAKMGISPYATTYYQNNGFAVTELLLRATHNLKAGKHFAIPVFAELVANPCSGHAYFSFGLTINPFLTTE